MVYLIICLVAFASSILTFFSGFGLGTILTPVFMIFFPVEVAIALTGIVHFFNNIFKLLLVGRKADKTVLLKFGIPAVIAAFLGSWLLLSIEDVQPLFSYVLFEKNIDVFPTPFLIAILLIIFASMDLIPYFSKLKFSSSLLSVGGFFSGFFGGLSGNQGALRSAFLIRAGLTKEAFIGTAIVVSTFVDLTRLSVYSKNFWNAGLAENMPLVLSATLSAILGAFLGNKLLRKVTLKSLQVTVAVMLILLSVGLGLGLI